MSLLQILTLLSLAGIWGSSFLFLKIVVPQFGPWQTAGLRVLLGGGALLIVSLALRSSWRVRQHLRHYIVLGLVNTGLPFCLYSLAAQRIPASYSVLLNSLAPVFGSIFLFMFGMERLDAKQVAGFMMAFLGVGVVSGMGPVAATPEVIWGLAAGTLAAACYGLGGTYMKMYAPRLPALGVAGASQLVAAVAILPLSFAPAVIFEANSFHWVALAALAFLCSGLAYVLYFNLVKSVGPAKALSVTFLMPVFGMFWGHLFLGEAITKSMVVGACLILVGTGLAIFGSKTR